MPNSVWAENSAEVAGQHSGAIKFKVNPTQVSEQMNHTVFLGVMTLALDLDPEQDSQLFGDSRSRSNKKSES